MPLKKYLASWTSSLLITALYEMHALKIVNYDRYFRFNLTEKVKGKKKKGNQMLVLIVYTSPITLTPSQSALKFKGVRLAKP